jgi:hypothetical protein
VERHGHRRWQVRDHLLVRSERRFQDTVEQAVGTKVFNTRQAKLEWYETSGGGVDVARQKVLGAKAHDGSLPSTRFMGGEPKKAATNVSDGSL